MVDGEFIITLPVAPVTLPVIISPNSYISSHSKIGFGTIIMNDVIINANSEIGNN